MAVIPTVARPPDTLAEPAIVAGRVTEGEPDDLGVLIGQSASGDGARRSAPSAIGTSSEPAVGCHFTPWGE